MRINTEAIRDAAKLETYGELVYALEEIIGEYDELQRQDEEKPGCGPRPDTGGIMLGRGILERIGREENKTDRLQFFQVMSISGTTYGSYEAASPLEALDKWARETSGGQSRTYREYCEFLRLPNEYELRDGFRVII